MVTTHREGPFLLVFSLKEIADQSIRYGIMVGNSVLEAVNIEEVVHLLENRTVKLRLLGSPTPTEISLLSTRVAVRKAPFLVLRPPLRRASLKAKANSYLLANPNFKVKERESTMHFPI